MRTDWKVTGKHHWIGSSQCTSKLMLDIGLKHLETTFRTSDQSMRASPRRLDRPHPHFCAECRLLPMFEGLRLGWRIGKGRGFVHCSVFTWLCHAMSSSSILTILQDHDLRQAAHCTWLSQTTPFEANVPAFAHFPLCSYIYSIYNLYQFIHLVFVGITFRPYNL